MHTHMENREVQDVRTTHITATEPVQILDAKETAQYYLVTEMNKLFNSKVPVQNGKP